MNKSIKTVAVLVGFFIGLGFYLAFWLLGYPSLFRLLAAAVAAVSGGWILFWWHSEEPARKVKPKQTRLSSRLRLSKRPRIVEAQKKLVETRSKRFPRKRDKEEQQA